MAEILTNKARPADGFAMNVTCKRCESELAIDGSDLSFGKWKVGGYWFAGTEEIEEHFSFDCPACGCESNFLSDEVVQTIPVGMREDLVADYHERKASGAMII